MAHENATPRPWTVERNTYGVTVRRPSEYGSTPICEIWANGDDREANAALIVEAVNAYDTLRAENERLTRKVDDLEAGLHDEETRVRHYSERVKELEAAAREALGCFEAAEAEGLSDRLASTTYTVPGSLYDLITRRLAYAPVSLRAALSEAQP